MGVATTMRGAHGEPGAVLHRIAASRRSIHQADRQPNSIDSPLNLKAEQQTLRFNVTYRFGG